MKTSIEELSIEDLEYRRQFLRAGIKLRSEEEQTRDKGAIAEINIQLKKLYDERDAKRLKEFKADFISLLKKYDASIDFSVGEGSDTHGLYDESIAVSFHNPLILGNHHRVWSDDVKLADGWGATAKDLEEYS